jgi:hypothetical protein
MSHDSHVTLLDFMHKVLPSSLRSFADCERKCECKHDSSQTIHGRPGARGTEMEVSVSKI